MFVCATGRGKYQKVDHLEGKGGEQTVVILRL
jgi:hypothetical protein